MAKKFKDVDRGWKKFKRRWLKQGKLNKVAKVGVQAPEAQDKEHGSEMVIIAATHEFGSSKAGRGNRTIIPSRSFIRSTFDENRKKYLKKLKVEGAKIALGKLPLEMGLKKTGEVYEADIVKKMSSGQIKPGLSNVTIAARAKKGGSGQAPLVDTGALKNSITTKVGNPVK